MGLTHMAMFDHIASAPHQCKFSHQCPETCDLPGNCILQLRDSHDNVVHIIDSALDRATWKALQIQDLLNLINSSRNGISLKLNLVSVRQRCSERLLPCARSHEGVHYCSMNVCSHNENDYMRYASPHRDFERSIRAHFCEECCPRCGGSCIYPVGHHGPHTTIHAVSADDQMDCAEYCHIKSHEHYVECWKPMQCPFQAYEECGDGIIHRVSHSRFWSLLRWQDPSWRKYKSQVEVATLKDRYEDFQCVKNSDILESVKQRHFIFALDCSDTMIGEPWKRMLVSMHSFIHRISPSRVECNTKQWRGCNNDVISVMTFNKEARWFCTELSVQLFLDCEKAITFRGGRKRYTAALRLIGEALKKNEHTRYTSVVFIYTDGKKGERFDALNDFAEKFRCRHSDGLNGFEVVGHGDRDAPRKPSDSAGVSYYTLSGIDLHEERDRFTSQIIKKTCFLASF
ncbi:unnamed protein product [Albugo candida]|uniref:VWFA domain-containing protein n=1 Tax=Albugo candida TaxID=65357 RepID=A0A024G1N8_9STRA|nr:unnamed protein product [Albugo candida]|eukprot:CCI40228.1 unnamed protein product [Albugo candida]